MKEADLKMKASAYLSPSARALLKPVYLHSRAESCTEKKEMPPTSQSTIRGRESGSLNCLSSGYAEAEEGGKPAPSEKRGSLPTCLSVQ